jgi:hypothetical protein
LQPYKCIWKPWKVYCSRAREVQNIDRLGEFSAASELTAQCRQGDAHAVAFSSHVNISRGMLPECTGDMHQEEDSDCFVFKNNARMSTAHTYKTSCEEASLQKVGYSLSDHLHPKDLSFGFSANVLSKTLATPGGQCTLSSLASCEIHYEPSMA